MYRHVLILGSMIAFSSLLLADTVPQNSGSKSSRWLQLVSATQQESGNEPDNHEIAKQNKKARKQQEKAEKQRRKQEEKERQKQLKKQQQQAAAERKKEIEKENKEIAKQRKAQQKEEMKEAKERGHYEEREQARNVLTPPPQAVNDRDRAAQDHDDQYPRDRDRDPDQDRDRDRQNVAQAQNTPPPAPPVVNHPDRDQVTRDRDDQYRRDHDQDKDRDRIARDRDDQRRDHDRDYDRDRDRQNVTGTPPPATPPPASTSQDQDRDRIARERDDRYRRDRDYDRMAYDRRDYDRDRDRDHDRDRFRRDRDYAREHGIRRDRPGRMRGYDLEHIPLATNPAPGAVQAQRNVRQAIYSQLPSSNVMVLLNNNNQIVLRGSAPSPGLRSRLLQLAGAAAGGYLIVDQLASDAVSSAAGSAASAAVGGIGSLFHGSGSDNSGYYGNYSSPSSGGSVASNTYGSTGTSGSYYASNPSSSGLQAGTNGCVNVYNSQVVITGQAASQADADAIRQVAQQFGGVNANIVNQLTVNGASVSNSSSAGGSSPMPNSSTSATLVSPGSVVCMNADNSNQVLLTGSVRSPGELGTVERTVQPILGNQRLVDQINTPTSTVANGGASGTAASSSGAPAASPSNASPKIIQTRVQEAVHSLPRLSNVDAEVSGNQVRLSGSVPSRDDDDDARDIAQQYAPGHEIVDNLTISRGRDNTSSVQKPNP